MTISTNRLATRLLRTGLALALLAAPTSAIAAKVGKEIVTSRSRENLASITKTAYQISTADYDAECEGKSPQTIDGNLVLTNAVEFENNRCVKWVKGNVTIDTTSATKRLTMPWLQQIDGDLDLEGHGQLPYARLPRLTAVKGEIDIEFWTGGTRWEARKMKKHDGTMYVRAGSLSDLRGFDELENLGKLEIWLRPVAPPANQQTPTFKGLAGLESVGSLEIETTAEQAFQSADFLSRLVEVRGKADVATKYSLFGMDAIEEIGGRLEVFVEDNYGDSAADGLDSLREVGGDFTWDGSDLFDIDALANLQTVGGDLELPLDTTSLNGFSSLQSVGGDFSLVGDVDVPDLSALSSLTAVYGRLTIESSGVGSLNGLQGVTWVGSLRIHDNAGLASVSALGNTAMPSYSTAQITDNSPLTDCQALTLLNSMSIPSTTVKTVDGNVSPCTYYMAIDSSTAASVIQSTTSSNTFSSTGRYSIGR